MCVSKHTCFKSVLFPNISILNLLKFLNVELRLLFWPFIDVVFTMSTDHKLSNNDVEILRTFS